MKDPTRFTVSYTGLCGGELENLEIETRLTDESFGCVSALKKKTRLCTSSKEKRILKYLLKS